MYGNCKKVNHSSFFTCCVILYATFISLRANVLSIYKIQCTFIIYLWFIYCDSTLFKTIKLYRIDVTILHTLFYYFMSKCLSLSDKTSLILKSILCNVTVMKLWWFERDFFLGNIFLKLGLCCIS